MLREKVTCRRIEGSLCARAPSPSIRLVDCVKSAGFTGVLARRLTPERRTPQPRPGRSHSIHQRGPGRDGTAAARAGLLAGGQTFVERVDRRAIEFGFAALHQHVAEGGDQATDDRSQDVDEQEGACAAERVADERRSERAGRVEGATRDRADREYGGTKG